MAYQRAGIDLGMQVWLRDMAAQVREKLYGAAGCPEWGTRFREIERTGMSVGREISRLVMEQEGRTKVSRGEQRRENKGENKGVRRTKVSGTVSDRITKGENKGVRNRFWPNHQGNG